MVSRRRAVELVEVLLARQRAEALTRCGTAPEVAVLDVEAHALGWLVICQSVEYLRTRAVMKVKSVRPADPLPAVVRAILRTDGSLAAMRHLRRHTPALMPAQAKAYVAAVCDEGEPPDELAALTRTPADSPPLAIETLAGPSQ